MVARFALARHDLVARYTSVLRNGGGSTAGAWLNNRMLLRLAPRSAETIHLRMIFDNTRRNNLTCFLLWSGTSRAVVNLDQHHQRHDRPDSWNRLQHMQRGGIMPFGILANDVFESVDHLVVKSNKSKISAARLLAAIFGVLSGLGGILHGVGEILQGNVVPDGMFIESWTQGPIATHMGGDPAMTIVPNLLITGILALIVSITVIVWSVAYVHRKHGGLILLLLAIVMFLVGGGFGPPTLGLLAGIGGLGINAPYTWWRTHLHAKVQRFLAVLWPWVFGVCVINGVFLIVGHVIGVILFGMTNPAVFLNSFFLAVVLLLFSILTGIAYDIQLIQKNKT